MAHVEAICIARRASVPMEALAEVEAVAGGGLAGDRYCEKVGFYSPRPSEPGAREVTLFEGEVLDRLDVEHGIKLRAVEHRRNLTTRGVRVAELVGRRFRIGEAVLEGVKDCPPCEHMQELAGKPVLRLLVDDGGIRARVVEGGLIRVGDDLTVLSAEPSTVAPLSA